MTPSQFKEAREALGLNQTEAAQALGYGNRARIYQIENGKEKPGNAVVLLLRAYLLHPRLINKLKGGGTDNE